MTAQFNLQSEYNSLPLELRKQVDTFVHLLKVKKNDKQGKPAKIVKREFGILKGKLKVSKDFDQPLEDFADYSE